MKKLILIIFAVLIVLVSILFMMKYVRNENDKKALNSNPLYVNFQKEKSVSELIKKMDGIKEASVTVDVLKDSNVKIATVTLSSSKKVSKEQIDEIIKLLSINFDSLERKNIVITNEKMEIIFPDE